METAKARPRREQEQFFSQYLVGRGIDIGCGSDPITPDCDRWDLSFGSSDATGMSGVLNQTYDWVYSSHCLEHLHHPDIALYNWWRILKPNGTLIICVPHRNLYEKKTSLPSRWNPDHKLFFLPSHDDPPNTYSLLHLFQRSVLWPYRLISLRELSCGHTITDPLQHSDGEYSIELIVRKSD